MFCPHYLLPKVPSRRADPSQPGARGRVQSCPSREPGWQRRHPLLLERRTRLEASKLPARYLHDWEAPARGECQNLRGHRRMAECRIQLKAWTHSCSLERASGSNHLSVRDPRRLESPILAVAAHVRSDVDPRKTAVLRRLVIRLLLRGGGAFVVQYMTGLVVQLWAPIDGHYPEVAYQAAFALNVGLQIVAGLWFAAPICSPGYPKILAACKMACLRIAESLDILSHVRNQNTLGPDRLRLDRRAHHDVGCDAMDGLASRLSAATRTPLV